jgi:hypothetical protein
VVQTRPRSQKTTRTTLQASSPSSWIAK